MKTIKILISTLLLITVFFACKSVDPAVEKIAGTWEYKRFKTHPDSSMNEVPELSVVIFSTGGTLGYMGKVPFPGDKCNQAERYTISGDVLRFQFGAANCIPEVDTVALETAKIVEYSGTAMTVHWGQRWMWLERVRL
jgi:hypothetical protein